MKALKFLFMIVLGLIVGVGGYWGYITYLNDDLSLPQLADLPVILPFEIPFLAEDQAQPITETPTAVPEIAAVATPVTEDVPTEANNGPNTQPQTVAADNTATTPIEATPPTHPAQVKILIADAVKTLDPYLMVSTHPESSISSHIWDTLTKLNHDLVVVPHLAESWRIVNNVTWEFKLRSGISFHNAESVDAQAVLFSVERSRGLPNSLETFASDVGLKEIEMVDELTVRFVTHEPVANLPYHLSFLEILPPLYYGQTDLAQAALEPVGSGPYQLTDLLPGQKIDLEGMSTYWQGTPSINRLIFETVPILQDRMVTLTGEDNVLATDLPPFLSSAWPVPDSRLVYTESTQRMFIGLSNQPDSPFSQLKVRQALNYAVDVTPIVEDLLLGYGDRYGSWVNPPHAHPDLKPWPYDPAQAKTLLAEAGFTKGFSTTLVIPLGLYHNESAIAQMITQQLAEVGVTVVVEEMEWPIYIRRLLTEEPPPMFLLGLNSHGDPIEDAKNLSATFPFNPTGWANPFFEDAINRAGQSLQDDVRTRRLLEAQEIAYQEAPWIWLWRSYDFYGISDNIQWSPRRDGLVNLYQSDSSPAEASQ